MTPEQAQVLHDARKAAGPDHDIVSCWCCCMDCDFGQDAAGNITSWLDETGRREMR